MHPVDSGGRPLRYRVFASEKGNYGIALAGTGLSTADIIRDFYQAEQMALLFTANQLSPIQLEEALTDGLSR